MDNIQRRKYKEKAKDSFKTKKNLFLFSIAIEDIESFTKSDFTTFKISSELVKLYTTEYWQQPEEKTIRKLTIKEIYKKINEIELSNIELIKSLETEYIATFDTVLPEKDFLNIINTKNCKYCGISISKIELLAEKRKLYKKSLRGWTLEIDRLDSNLEYFPENCVAACYWCNNAKTDEFSPSEFEGIGLAIKEIWRKRLL